MILAQLGLFDMAYTHFKQEFLFFAEAECFVQKIKVAQLGVPRARTAFRRILIKGPRCSANI